MAADPLETWLLDACAAEGAPQATIDGLAAAFDAAGVQTAARLKGWGFGAALQQPMDPAAAARFMGRLVVDGGTAVVDDVQTRTIVMDVLRRCAAAHSESLASTRPFGGDAAAAALAAAVAAAAAAGHTPPDRGGGAAGAGTAQGAEDAERRSIASCYSELEQLQGRPVDLPGRATFVAAARTSVSNYGYISVMPSHSDVKTLGTAGGAKRKITLSDIEAGIGAHIAFDEKVAAPLIGMPACYSACRVLMNGLAAAMSIKISADAYGKRDVGWVLPPGSPKQVRLLGTAVVFERFLWALIMMPTADPAAFVKTADAVVGEFLRIHAKMTQHADEIINHLVDAQPFRFIPRGGAEEGSDAGSAYSTVLTAHGGGGSPKSVCWGWAHSGRCHDPNCRFEHPSISQKGRSPSSGAGGRDHSWDSGGGGPAWGKNVSWGDSHPSKAQKGGGKGEKKGGRGKGKGK